MGMEADFRNKLERYFKMLPVEAVYLFGSAGTNRENALSDVDLAVLFDSHLERKKRFDMRLKILTEVGALLGREDVEVIDLEEMPLTVRHSAVAPRRLVFEAVPAGRRALFEADTLSRYGDYSYFVKQNTLISLPSIGRTDYGNRR